MPEQAYTRYARDVAVGGTSVERRARFIVRTYNHLFLAILAFAALEVALWYSGLMLTLAIVVSRAWFVALGGFIVVGWLASSMAHRARSLTTQYAGLGAMVVAEA